MHFPSLLRLQVEKGIAKLLSFYFYKTRHIELSRQLIILLGSVAEPYQSFGSSQMTKPD